MSFNHATTGRNDPRRSNHDDLHLLYCQPLFCFVLFLTRLYRQTALDRVYKTLCTYLRKCGWERQCPFQYSHLVKTSPVILVFYGRLACELLITETAAKKLPELVTHSCSSRARNMKWHSPRGCWHNNIFHVFLRTWKVLYKIHVRAWLALWDHF